MEVTDEALTVAKLRAKVEALEFKAAGGLAYRVSKSPVVFDRQGNSRPDTEGRLKCAYEKKHAAELHVYVCSDDGRVGPEDTPAARRFASAKPMPQSIIMDEEANDAEVPYGDYRTTIDLDKLQSYWVEYGYLLKPPNVQ
jgi:hypothetical protein